MKIRIATLDCLIEYDVKQNGYPEDEDKDWYQINDIGVVITQYKKGCKIENWHPWVTIIGFTVVN